MTAAGLGKLRKTPGIVQTGWRTGDGDVFVSVWQRKIYRLWTELLEYLERNKHRHKENQANELNGNNY